MNRSFFTLLLLAAGSLPALAGPRTSGTYTVSTEVVSSGGGRATSVRYTNEASVGDVAGISTLAAPTGVVKAGYAGQLYEVTALTVDASPASVNETAARQLTARQTLDDDTVLAANSNTVAWSVVSGPIVSITTGGLATAGVVYQNTAATVRGTLGGLSGNLLLTVNETIADNFGTYAGDGLSDDWQVQFFGVGNPLATPLADPDHDGQNNLFEFTAGLIPTDAASRFIVSIAPVPGFPAQKRIIFSPVVSGRTYVVKASTNFTGWSAMTASPPTDVGPERTITDLNASGGSKFYHVEITKP